MDGAKGSMGSETLDSMSHTKRVPVTSSQPHTKRHRSSSPGDSNEENDTIGPKRKHFKASENVTSPSTHLHLPHASDPPTTLTAKLTAILTILTSPRNQSLAASTHYLATPTPNRNPVAKALSEMHPDERRQWDAYISNPHFHLPTINWETDTKPAPTSANHSRKPSAEEKR